MDADAAATVEPAFAMAGRRDQLPLVLASLDSPQATVSAPTITAEAGRAQLNYTDVLEASTPELDDLVRLQDRYGRS